MKISFTVKDKEKKSNKKDIKFEDIFDEVENAYTNLMTEALKDDCDIELHYRGTDPDETYVKVNGNGVSCILSLVGVAKSLASDMGMSNDLLKSLFDDVGIETKEVVKHE